MPRSENTKKVTRIQRAKIDAILEAGLDVFSTHGFRGSTLDMVADTAGLSKPNLLYYFDSKDAIHKQLMDQMLETWLDPLKLISADGDAVEEILNYVHRKLAASREFPRESRLFANEVLQGAPKLLPALKGPLRQLVDEKVGIIQQWIDAEKILPIDPVHLIFSIWATTQHYADFDVQVRAVAADRNDSQRWESAQDYLTTLYTRLLSPK